MLVLVQRRKQVGMPMICRFADWELDTGLFELRYQGSPRQVEPQVFNLIELLVRNHHRVVGRDEILAELWKGRVVTDATLSTCVKSARQALGDTGRAQALIRTVSGRGFRFVGEVDIVEGDAPTAITPVTGGGEILPPAETCEDALVTRPSIAVLPFETVGIGETPSTIADALPHDLIAELSRLHWLFVIARASTFRFRSAEADLDEVRNSLKVRYCLSGAVELLGRVITISVELCDTDDKGVVWSDRFRAELDAVHEIREEIVRAVVTALEIRIPLHEAQRARLRSPQHLDAWSAYHLGLHHMYRFNKLDNARATAMFQQAVALEPNFARAYAGLSFTHFQDALLRYDDNVQRAIQLTYQFAAKALEHDEVDPFANFTMGRAFMLRGDLEGSLSWLDRANALNPNFAQARYSRAWSQSLLGETAESLVNTDAALALSPLDPLAYAMLGVRSFSHMGRDEPAEAAAWAERAANSPGAHVLIELIAVAAHGMDGNDARARSWAASARQRAPGISSEEFLRAFPFRDPQVRARIGAILKKYGF